MGPNGIFALEVKAYNGLYRNTGMKWQYKSFGRWRLFTKNPTRQALTNALRLHDHLKQRGAEVHVNPRVVWAGSGRLLLDNPKVPIWQLATPDYLLKDLSKRREVSEHLLTSVNTILAS